MKFKLIIASVPDAATGQAALQIRQPMHRERLA